MALDKKSEKYIVGRHVRVVAVELDFKKWCY